MRRRRDSECESLDFETSWWKPRRRLLPPCNWEGWGSRSKSKCICRFGDENLWVLRSDGLHFLYESLLSGGPRDRLLNISVGWDKIMTLECKYRYMQIRAKGEFLIGMCSLMDSGWPSVLGSTLMVGITH